MFPIGQRRRGSQLASPSVSISSFRGSSVWPTLVCQIVMDVAVTLAKRCPFRDMRRASTGSFRGSLTAARLVPVEASEEGVGSASSRSTRLTAGVLGVAGVVGSAPCWAVDCGEPSRRGLLEADRAAWLREGSSNGFRSPSSDTTSLNSGPELLLVAKILGVPVGQYISRACPSET